MTKIYYFSGTGNTFWSAREIARTIGGACELVNIGSEAQKSEIIAEADAVVLLFPSYAFGLPLIVRRFIQTTVFRTAYAAAFVTFGSSPGGTLAQAARVLKRKNIKTVYYGRIPAQENYTAIFGLPPEEKLRRRLETQRDATREAAKIVTERRVNRIHTFRPFSFFVWLLFSLATKIFRKFYRVSDACGGCGICEKLCPVSAISLRGGRPVFSAKCEHCTGCLNWCPRKAISFGLMGNRTPRYHHPEISVNSMFRPNSHSENDEP